MTGEVYVLGKDGEPLLPTRRFWRVRRLLKAKKARVAYRKPFTIQLLYDTPNGTQPMCGGTDPGRTNLGEAAIDEDGSVHCMAHAATRNKEIPKLMQDRAAHRRASRGGERRRRERRAAANGTEHEPYEMERVLPGCREPIICKGIRNTEARFNNRARPEGWVTPTARQLVQTHLNMADKMCRLMPITDWTIEINKFSFMKMEDGGVRGIDCQNGRLKNWPSAEAYVSAEQGGRCSICGEPIEHCHHIIPKSKGGADVPENLVGLCRCCHDKVHKEKKVKAQIAKIGRNRNMRRSPS